MEYKKYLYVIYATIHLKKISPSQKPQNDQLPFAD